MARARLPGSLMSYQIIFGTNLKEGTRKLFRFPQDKKRGDAEDASLNADTT